MHPSEKALGTVPFLNSTLEYVKTTGGEWRPDSLEAMDAQVSEYSRSPGLCLTTKLRAFGDDIRKNPIRAVVAGKKLQERADELVTQAVNADEKARASSAEVRRRREQAGGAMVDFLPRDPLPHALTISRRAIGNITASRLRKEVKKIVRHPSNIVVHRSNITQEERADDIFTSVAGKRAASMVSANAEQPIPPNIEGLPPQARPQKFNIANPSSERSGSSNIVQGDDLASAPQTRPETNARHIFSLGTNFKCSNVQFNQHPGPAVCVSKRWIHKASALLPRAFSNFRRYLSAAAAEVRQGRRTPIPMSRSIALTPRGGEQSRLPVATVYFDAESSFGSEDDSPSQENHWEVGDSSERD
ncbi:hypothetical protein DFH07DRAFT_781590 [Mycena maculata]|uniref:Uncharacterized protein n=1 Tax=Mycena maculata TaxID=230809 RepID=A0AAD7MS24_9AGAR|nr:hypothetical protein DFH07DRAFT_781590 [Mycena maculata]